MWQMSVPDRLPWASVPGILPNSLSLHRNAALEVQKGGFIPVQDALLRLEELLQHQQCCIPPSLGAGSSGKGTFPTGAQQNPSLGQGASPQTPRLAHKLTDIQMGTETPGEPGTCLPLQLCFYGLMFLRVYFSAAFLQSPIYAGAKIFAVTP